MYLFQSQYPGLEGLPWSERNRIIKTATLKYDGWLNLRSFTHSLFVILLPFAVLMTAVPLAKMGLVDWERYRSAMAPVILGNDYLFVGFSIFAGVYMYLRMTNSGLDAIVQAYLGDMQIMASVGVNALQATSVGPQLAKKRRFNGRLLILIYAIVIVVSSIVLISEFGQGIPKAKQIYNGVLDVKGIQLDMSEHEVAMQVPGLEETPFDRKQSSTYQKLSCKTRYLDDATRCKLTLANRPVKSADFYFHADHLGHLVVKFEEEYFETVNAGLTETFGNPYSEERTPLKNRLTGVASVYVVKIWADGKGRGLILTNHVRNGESYLPTGIVQLVDRNFNDARETDSAALGSKPDKKDI